MACVRLGLRVAPGATRDEIVGRYGDRWKVRVASPPDRGRANDAVLALVAAALGIPDRRVKLVAGAAARDKVIEVEGLTREDVDRLLAAQQGKGDQ